MSRKMESWQHLAQNSEFCKVFFFLYALAHWWCLLKRMLTTVVLGIKKKEKETWTEENCICARNLMSFHASNIHDSCGTDWTCVALCYWGVCVPTSVTSNWVLCDLLNCLLVFAHKTDLFIVVWLYMCFPTCLVLEYRNMYIKK